MKTGEIWLAQRAPTVGSAIQKTRPCVVIALNEMNAHLRTVIVAPMTTGSRPAHFRIPVTFQGKQGLIVLDQVRTLDRARLVKRLGALRPPTLAAALRTLQDKFAPCALRQGRSVLTLAEIAHDARRPHQHHPRSPTPCSSAISPPR